MTLDGRTLSVIQQSHPDVGWPVSLQQTKSANERCVAMYDAQLTLFFHSQVAWKLERLVLTLFANLGTLSVTAARKILMQP